MLNIIKNEFIKSRKINALLITNILIMASVFLIYFTMNKFGEEGFLRSSEVLNMFFASTISIIPYLIVILISKTITEEFNNGGMQIYLINPITRSEILIGKIAFILINIIITMLTQILISFTFSGIFIQVPTLEMAINTICRYLVTIIPIIGLICILFVPALIINTSRNSISFGFAVIAIGPIITSIYTNIKPYSILWIIKNIENYGENLFINITISIVYILIGYMFSSYIFNYRDIR